MLFKQIIQRKVINFMTFRNYHQHNMTAINIKNLSDQQIKEFFNSFDTVLTDCDGVLWIHTTALPNAASVMNTFRTAGKKVFYVTNNSTHTRNEFVEKCSNLKFEATLDDIICTANLCARYLKNLNFQKKVYIIGPQAITKELEEVGISSYGVGPDVANPGSPYRSFPKDPEVGAVVVGFDEHFSYPKIIKAATYLNDPNVHFIATNTDTRFPGPGNIVIPGTGCLVRCIESCSERKAVIMGKPERYTAEVLKEVYNIHPERTLMIGDRCNTDILLGTRCGFKTLLVLTGVTKIEEVENWKKSTLSEERDLVPDYYIEKLGDLLPYLERYVTKNRAMEA